MPYETNGPDERRAQGGNPNGFAYDPAVFAAPATAFPDTSNSEITCPGYTPQGGEPGDEFDHPTDLPPEQDVPWWQQRSVHAAGYAVVAIGLVTTAIVGGFISKDETPDPTPASHAPANASPDAAPSTSRPHEKATQAPRHTAAPTPSASARDTSGTSYYEIDGPGSKSVGRMQGAAHALQHETKFLGVHISGDGCLQNTPYEHGVIKVEGIYEPGDSEVIIHPEDPLHHPDEPDLVFKPTPGKLDSSQISPADDRTEQYTKDHSCNLTYGQVDNPYHGF